MSQDIRTRKGGTILEEGLLSCKPSFLLTGLYCCANLRDGEMNLYSIIEKRCVFIFMKTDKKSGFTLIELLIVVAIIAILAAIAIPNFLAAQVRSKVSKTKAELRTLATALESYYIDNNTWPQDGTELWATQAYYWYVPNDVTTPVAYISNVNLKDPFRGSLNPGDDPLLTRYRYSNTVDGVLGRLATTPYYRDAFGAWRVIGLGPDQGYSPDYDGDQTIWGIYDITVPYDPTNGTVSFGDIIRSQKYTNNYGG